LKKWTTLKPDALGLSGPHVPKSRNLTNLSAAAINDFTAVDFRMFKERGGVTAMIQFINVPPILLNSLLHPDSAPGRYRRLTPDERTDDKLLMAALLLRGTPNLSPAEALAACPMSPSRVPRRPSATPC